MSKEHTKSIETRRNIYAVGECLLDIIFQNNQPAAAVPGGSMLNSAVSLGKVGLAVHLISDLTHDRVADIITSFLEKNGVSTEYINRYTEGKTAVSLAFLDKSGDADYSFYKIYPKHRLTGEFPHVTEKDIVLYGSFYSLTPELRRPLIHFLKKARKAGAILIYDPNIRRSHIGNIEKLRPTIMENISLSTIVRGSDEDFMNIFNMHSSMDAFSKLYRAGAKALIYTKSNAGVELHTPKFHVPIDVPNIQEVSTIGAGDAFNAGIIHDLIAQNIFDADIETLEMEKWSSILNKAVLFATDVCKSYDNYISDKFAHEILS